MFQHNKKHFYNLIFRALFLLAYREQRNKILISKKRQNYFSAQAFIFHE
jgi:hypothetical protein